MTYQGLVEQKENEQIEDILVREGDVLHRLQDNYDKQTVVNRMKQGNSILVPIDGKYNPFQIALIYQFIGFSDKKILKMRVSQPATLNQLNNLTPTIDKTIYLLNTEAYLHDFVTGSNRWNKIKKVRDPRTLGSLDLLKQYRIIEE